jgi:hypothetical protein
MKMTKIYSLSGIYFSILDINALDPSISPLHTTTQSLHTGGGDKMATRIMPRHLKTKIW